MDVQRWLAEIRAELIREKLPRGYVERMISELSEHLTNFMEESISKDAHSPQGTDYHQVVERLGEPHKLATTAATEFSRRRFSRRHPILMFGVLPIVMLPLLWFGGMTTLVLISQLLGVSNDSEFLDLSEAKYSQAVVATWVVRGMALASILLCAVFLCRLARKAAVGWKWTMLACGLLSVISGLIFFRAYSWDQGEHGAFVIGLSMYSLPTVPQLIQLVAPLAIGGWALWRQKSRQFGELAT